MPCTIPFQAQDYALASRGLSSRVSGALDRPNQFALRHYLLGMIDYHSGVEHWGLNKQFDKHGCLSGKKNIVTLS